MEMYLKTKFHNNHTVGKLDAGFSLAEPQQAHEITQSDRGEDQGVPGIGSSSTSQQLTAFHNLNSASQALVN